jgi:tRNA(fMet)-specific endonuclease VapC
MAIFILDTATLTHLQRGHPRVTAEVQARSNDLIGATSVNVEEVLGGWFAMVRQAKSHLEIAKASLRLANAVAFLGRYPIFPQTEPSLLRFDALVRLKLNVGRMDLKIASIGLELAATVVTNNLRDFTRVPGLSVVDWTV